MGDWKGLAAYPNVRATFAPAIKSRSRSLLLDEHQIVISRPQSPNACCQRHEKLPPYRHLEALFVSQQAYCAHVRRVVRPVLLLAALLWVVWVTLPLQTSSADPRHQPVHVSRQSAPSPGKPTLAVAPATLPLVPTHPAAVIVRVGNDGATTLTALKLTADAPSGVTVTMSPEEVPDIPPGGSVTVRAVVSGELTVDPGSVLFTLKSDVGGIRGEAIASTQLTTLTKLVDVALTGSVNVTDTKAADLVAVITNPTSARFKVSLAVGTSTRLHATVDPPDQLELEGNSSRAFRVTIKTVKSARLSKGREALLLTTRTELIGSVGQPATTLGTPTPVQVQEGTTTYVLESAPFGEEIVTGPLGVTSVLLVPGLAGLMVGFAFLRRHYSDRGQSAPSWTEASKNVLSLAGVVVLSIVVAAVYWLTRSINLFQAYRLSDIGWATLGTILVCIVIGVFALVLARYVTPQVSSRSREDEVLRKAARFEDSMERAVVTCETDGSKKGLVIASGFGSIAASPPITYQGIPGTDLQPLRRTNSLSEARRYIKGHPGKIILKFADNDATFINDPKTAPFRLSSENERLLRWVDE